MTRNTMPVHVIKNERPQNIIPSTNYICFQMISKEKELNLYEWEAKRYEADDRKRKQGLKRLFNSLETTHFSLKNTSNTGKRLLFLPSYPSDIPQYNHKAREQLRSNVNYHNKHKSNVFSLASQPQKQGRTNPERERWESGYLKKYILLKIRQCIK